jgi:SAM-dependent methyltransferase
MAQDSSRPEFWNTRFRDGVTPWDAGGVPQKLAIWLQTKKSSLKVLIPGCGTGYEVRLFAERGHDVLAIDFSDAAVDAARRELGSLSKLVKKADFFEFETAGFDLVYERAFLCALPRSLWPAWGRRMAELVRPGGELAGLYYLDDNERGPPFGISREGLERLLAPAFKRESEKPIPAEQSLPVFKGREIWQVWKRRL